MPELTLNLTPGDRVFVTDGVLRVVAVGPAKCWLAVRPGGGEECLMRIPLRSPVRVLEWTWVVMTGHRWAAGCRGVSLAVADDWGKPRVQKAA